MFKTLIVARYTFIELYKSKIIFNVFLLGLALSLITYIASEFSYGTPAKIALDFGLGVTSLSAVAIAIFMGVNLIRQEIESRTLYMVLSRPISRSAFLIGRVLGMILILALNISILGIMTLSLFFIMGGEYSSLISWAYLFLILEASIVLLIVIAFSLITNPVISVINTLALFTVGHAIAGTFKLLNNNPVLAKILKVYSYIAPDFSKLNIKDYLLYKENLDSSILFNITAYGLVYSLAILLINISLFKNKNLD